MTTDASSLRADPGTRAVLDMVEKSGAPSMHTLSPEEARLGMRAGGEVLDFAPPQIADVLNRTIPGPAGEIAVRCYYPTSVKDLPVLLYFHGGGFVIGDLDTHDNICRALCLAGDCIVMSVDYRLAPEHPYPGAVEDAIAAFDWLCLHAAEIGADSSRLAVGGDSAGGTLAAVVALHAREQNNSTLRVQLLLYPVVDHGMEYPSHREHADTYPITKPVLDWFWTQYFAGDAAATHETRLHPWSSPLRAQSHAGLAPAYVLTAGLDPLRDEGAAYAERLGASGVETFYQCAMGAVHGFLRMGKLVPATHDALAAAGGFLRARVHGDGLSL